VKKALKFMLVVFVYSALFMIVSAILPFSLNFKVENMDVDSSATTFLIISNAFHCFVICFIAAYSSWRGAKRVLGITFVVFMISSFMTQIETLFFGDAFAALTRMDVVLIMLQSLPSTVGATMLAVKFYGGKDTVSESGLKLNRQLVIRIVVLMLIYTAIYFLFGYFVAWQFEELRVFYTGSTEDAGFIGQLANNWSDQPIIFPVQCLRGIMFASFLIPLLSMLSHNKKAFITSACLVYLTTAVVLVIPNVLFPDAVRRVHFIEITSSMLLFGIIAGLMLYTSSNQYEVKTSGSSKTNKTY
jgi:hypothetical protein